MGIVVSKIKIKESNAAYLRYSQCRKFTHGNYGVYYSIQFTIVLINTIWSQIVGRSVGYSHARSLCSNCAHTQIDMTRSSAGGISVLDLWGGIMIAKFVCSESRDFYPVTLREMPCVDDASANMTVLTVLTISLSIDARCNGRVYDLAINVSAFSTIIREISREKQTRQHRRIPRIRPKWTLYCVAFGHRRCHKIFSGHVMTEECCLFSRIFNRLIHFRASRRIMRRCFKGTCNGQVGNARS